MPDYRGYITNDGFLFEASAAELQIPVVISKILIGSGILPDNESPAERKQMINKIKEFPAIVFKDKQNPGQFIARCTIPPDDAINGQGYFINEMGVELGNEGAGILYAYRRVSADFKPVISSGEIKSFIYQLRFIPSNASNIDVTVDENGAYVTEAELENHRQNPDHPLATAERAGFIKIASAEDVESMAEDVAITPKQAEEVSRSSGNKAGFVKGNESTRGFLTACVLRRDTALSPNWEAIENSSHKPVNFLGVTPANGGADIKVSHKQGAVGAVLAVTDETFALDGITLGSSGGGGETVVSFGAPCNYVVDLDDKSVAVNGRYFSPDRFSVTISTVGEITLGHPSSRSCMTPIVSHTTKGLTLEPLRPHYVRGGIGVSTKLFLAAKAKGLVTAPSGVFTIGKTPWLPADVVFNWDQETQTLTVNHPSTFGNDAVSSISYTDSLPVNISVFGVTSTSFSVRFSRLDGGVVTPGAMTAFSFQRGETVIKNPTGKLLVDLGRVQLLASQVDSSSGNVWFLSLQQE